LASSINYWEVAQLPCIAFPLRWRFIKTDLLGQRLYHFHLHKFLPLAEAIKSRTSLFPLPPPAYSRPSAVGVASGDRLTYIVSDFINRLRSSLSESFWGLTYEITELALPRHLSAWITFSILAFIHLEILDSMLSSSTVWNAAGIERPCLSVCSWGASKLLPADFNIYDLQYTFLPSDVNLRNFLRWEERSAHLHYWEISCCAEFTNIRSYQTIHETSVGSTTCRVGMYASVQNKFVTISLCISYLRAFADRKI